MNSIKIHCITTGWVQIKLHHQLARFLKRPARVLDILTDCKWSSHLPIGCWLIEHPEGLIMVDTGESSHANDKGYQPWWHPFMRFCERRSVRPEEEVGAILKTKGFDPFTIKTVVMTHMHGDHAGGISNFPNSEFILSETEFSAINNNDAILNGYLKKHYPNWLKSQICTVDFSDGEFENFAKSTAITADRKVRLVPTPGHTEGHQSVIVDMGEYYVFIGGDASYGEKYLLNGNIDGVCINSKKHKESTAQIRELCLRKPTITQFAHDPDCERRLNDKIFTEV